MGGCYVVVFYAGETQSTHLLTAIIIFETKQGG